MHQLGNAFLITSEKLIKNPKVEVLLIFMQLNGTTNSSLHEKVEHMVKSGAHKN
jgi:hypothetical protein